MYGCYAWFCSLMKGRIRVARGPRYIFSAEPLEAPRFLGSQHFLWPRAFLGPGVLGGRAHFYGPRFGVPRAFLGPTLLGASALSGAQRFLERKCRTKNCAISERGAPRSARPATYAAFAILLIRHWFDVLIKDINLNS